jgi:3alpha(or 20beta)-hydroxysteroid dehydrogenase
MSLHPGPIRTPMTDGFGDEIAAAQPIPRFGTTEEVTKLMLFMAAEATYSTGSEWVIDGGAVLGPVIELPEE